MGSTTFRVKNNHGLNPINVPLPSLEAIITASTMGDLPFIDHDWFYVPGIWELPRWRYMYMFISLPCVHNTVFTFATQHNGNSAEAINHALLWSFVDSAKAEGSTPVILYLPDKTDYKEYAGKETPSLSILNKSGISHLDCVLP